MRILYVSGLTAHGLGGAQTETLKLVQEMTKLGLVTGIAIDTPIGVPGLTHFPIDYPKSKRSSAQIKEAINAFRPDLVHVLGGGIGFLRLIDTVVFKTPWVFTAHNLPPYERTFSSFYGNNIMYYLARDAQALPSTLAWKLFLRNGTFRNVISHSSAVSNCLRKYGCIETKIQEIPFGFSRQALPGVGVSPFAANSCPKVLTVAGLIHHKGIHDAVRVMKQLRTHHTNASYLIIGERRSLGYAKFLERLIADQGVDDIVSIIPDASEATKWAALQDADLYIQPSHEEGSCLAFAEAAAIVPRLVGTKTGEIAGLSATDSGMKVVPPKSPPALLKSILEALDATPTNNAIELRQRRLSSSHSWTEYFNRHLAVYFKYI